MKEGKNKMLESVSCVVFLNLALASGLLFLLYSIDGERDSIESMQEQLVLYERRIESVKELERVLSNTSSQQVEVKSTFLDKESLVNFIEELEYLSENSNLILDMRGVNMPDDKNSINEKPRFSFSVLGAFADIYKYIALLENDRYRTNFEKVFIQKAQEDGDWKASIELQLTSYQNEI